MQNKLIAALDVDNLKQAKTLVEKLGSAVDFYKVGLKLFIRTGPELITYLKKKRKRIFLDLKFHDIPNTVAEATREVVRLKVDMITLHASGGLTMLQASREACLDEASKKGVSPPLLLAVTVLTSLENLEFLGIKHSIRHQVLRLTQLAWKAKLSGVVCSPQEVALLREKFPRTLTIVTPGIRPEGESVGDQKRVWTPQKALKAGADYLVVGRPLYTAKDPKSVAVQLIS